MKTTLLILLFSSLLTAVDPAVGPKLPRKADNIAIQIAPEKYIWLSEHSGQTCVLAFILTTCVHCQFTTGVLNHIAKDYTGKDVWFAASAVEPMSSLNIPDFKIKFTPAFPVGYNEQSYVAKFLGLPPNDPVFFPQVVFIDRNGIIRAQFNGGDKPMEKDIQEKTLRETLDKTIKEGVRK